MQKSFGIPAMALAALFAIGTAAQAETAPAPHAKKAAARPAAKHKAKGAEPKPGKLVDEDGKEYVPNGDAVTELNCELGNKLTLYRNETDNEHMALRWQQRVHQMTRVSTSTGANRFENLRYGLVWIGIPAKGMLLDAKHGRQLANECKDAEQMAAKPAEATKPAKLLPPVDTPKADPSGRNQKSS